MSSVHELHVWTLRPGKREDLWQHVPTCEAQILCGLRGHTSGWQQVEQERERAGRGRGEEHGIGPGFSHSCSNGGRGGSDARLGERERLHRRDGHTVFIGSGLD